MNKTTLSAAAILLVMAVAFGAFGAHALKNHLSEEMMKVYQTGVQYHFYHSLGLLLVGVLAISRPSKWLNWSALFLAIGIFLFSGSLYVLAITEISMFGILTPFGGVCFIAGWALLFVGIWKR